MSGCKRRSGSQAKGKSPKPGHLFRGNNIFFPDEIMLAALVFGIGLCCGMIVGRLL